MSNVTKGFDEELWKAGVDEGAFSGDRDPEGVWYTLEVGGVKVALAAAVPGPADLVNVSYYVHPDYRGLGYGTKIASQVTDLHEKATFTIFKDNDASIKVALAALRNKFSMTMGHNVVRLTKTAGVALVEGEAREMLKRAVSVQAAERALQSRTIQSRLKGISSPQALARRTSNAAEEVAKKPLTQISKEDRKRILKTTRFVRMNVQDPKGGEIYKKIRASELGSSNQMELPI